jgi:MoxR-like ATPase
MVAKPTPKSLPSSGPSAPGEARRPEFPIGPRLEAVLALAYRARRSVLVEGATGIGKSEIVRQVAQSLGLQTRVLDLSLLEPPDLVGLPLIEDGRTRYALPSILPRDGAGILMLEELNRAERYIQQPAMQLLTARTLHDYVLPEGWVCFAAINPESGEYQVTPLDPALRARFLQIAVRADRATWLAWAVQHDVHPAVIALAQAHERFLDDVSPRSWTYAARLLSAAQPEELRDGQLMRDALAGYLPGAWVEALLALPQASAAPLDLDVRGLLASYDAAAQGKVRAYRDEGRTDRLDELTHRLAAILAGPEAGVLAARGALTLGAVEALLADLPGDLREKLQDALGGNATVTGLLEVGPADVLTGWSNGRAQRALTAWKAEPGKHHRVAMLVTAVRAHLKDPTRVAEVRKSNPMRVGLGQLLAQVGERWGMPLIDTLQKASITPIRPG